MSHTCTAYLHCNVRSLGPVSYTLKNAHHKRTWAQPSGSVYSPSSQGQRTWADRTPHLAHIGAALNAAAQRRREINWRRGDRLLFMGHGAGLSGSGSLCVLLLARGGVWHCGTGRAPPRRVCQRVFLRPAHLRGRHRHLPQPHLVGVLVFWEHRSAPVRAGGWCGVTEKEKGRTWGHQRRREAPLQPRVHRHPKLVPQERRTVPYGPHAQVSLGATRVTAGAGDRSHGNDGQYHTDCYLLNSRLWRRDAPHRYRDVTCIVTGVQVRPGSQCGAHRPSYCSE